MTATGNEPVKLSQLKTALEGIGSGGGVCALSKQPCLTA